MKKLRFWMVFLVTTLCISMGQSVFALSEEEACFDILSEKANSLYGVNLGSVYNGYSNIDVSTYTDFR